MTYRRTPTQTVLLVDDDEDCRLMYAVALEHAGFRVVLAETGRAGIELAAERRPDIILMDLHLPDIDGEEAARVIRADPGCAGTPIVAITARVSRHKPRELLAGPFDDARLKPIYPAEVVKLVQGWFAVQDEE